MTETKLEMTTYTEDDLSAEFPKTNSKMVELLRLQQEFEEAKQAYDQAREEMVSEMEANNIKSAEVFNKKIVYVGESLSTRFNSKQFKEDHPKLYEQYTKGKDAGISIRKASVSIR